MAEISLGELFRDFHLVKPLVKEIAYPDLFARKKQSQITEVEFFLTTGLSGNKTSGHPGEKSELVLSQSSGQIGDRLTLAGLHLKPNFAGTLFWVNEIEQKLPLGSFVTDATGNFQKDVTVPPSARGNRQTVKAVVTWPVGSLQVRETLHRTINEMVETLFLA